MIGAYVVTILMTLTGTSVGLFIIAMTGYALQRRDFEIRNGIMFYIYFTSLFSAGLVPFYLLMVQTLGLKDNYLAVLLPLMMNPWLIVLMKNFSRAIPHEITESGKIDGAGDFAIFVRLIMPSMTPALATVGLFLALGYWNEWYYSSLFLGSQIHYKPLQYHLYNIVNKVASLKNSVAGSNVVLTDLPGETLKMATAVIATGPIIFVYPFVRSTCSRPHRGVGERIIQQARRRPMKKLLTLLLAVALLTVLLPALAQVDTSEPVVITYLVTGDIPTNKTNETLEILNQKLKEKVNATLALEWIEWTDWTTKYNLALATQDGSIDLVGTATDWLNAWPNIQKGAFLPLSEEMLKTYAPKTWASVPQENWELCKYNDQIYLMPEDHFAQWTNHGFMYRGDWAKEAGLENYVTSWADLGTYFQYVKDNKEGVIPWDADGNGTSYGPQMSGGWQTSHTSNIYIEGLSVDLFYGESKENPYKLSRYYLEGDEFVNFAKNQKAWSDAGYWREDVLNYSGSVMDEMKEGLTGANQHHTQTWISQRHLLEEKQPGADLQFFWFGREMNNVVKLNITGAMAVASKQSPSALMVYDLMRTIRKSIAC